MAKKILLAGFHLFLLHLSLTSQPNPHFTPFKGTVYDMPEEYLNKGYGSWLSYLDVLQTVTLDSLAVPKSNTERTYFPGVKYRGRYGIVFTSELQIDQRGCYEFYLESDDGSRLWIENSLIIDNDMPHRMTAKRDSMMLDKGKYPVKVWYYSAFVPEYGLIFRSKTIPDTSACMRNTSRKLVTLGVNTVLFEFNAYEISPQGLVELDKLCSDLNQQTIRHIHVVGYTDNAGSDAYNEVLSLKRAESIIRHLRSKLKKPGITYKAEGKGALNADALNADQQYLNRRVEIYLE